MTGRDFVADVAAGRRKLPRMAETLGLRVVEATEGSFVMEGDAGPAFTNAFGGVHGGYLLALLDSTLTGAVWTSLPEGFSTATAQINVNMVRPAAPDGTTLRCEATLLSLGRTLATAEGRITSLESGKLIAHGTATCSVFPLDPAPTT